MPPLFINPETGHCESLEVAQACVLRALEAYQQIKKHVD